MTTLSRRVVGSAAWSISGSAVMRVGQLLVGIVAARLLAPHAFGVFAVTLVVYAIIVNVSELGVGSALVRTKGNVDDLAPTAVTISLVSASALGGAMALAAPWAASGLGAAEATGPIRLMALVVLFAGPSAVPAALLTREFRQDLRFAADAANFLVSNTLLLVLALQGHGVYALAWSRVAGQLVSMGLLLAVSPKRYPPGFERRVARRLVAFGAPLVGANLVGFAMASIDVVVIARVLGPSPLGLYQLASNVSGWPLQLFVPMLLSIGLPLLGRFNHQPHQLSELLTLLVKATAMVFLPVAAVLAALSSEVVAALYGATWAGAAPILGVLAVYGGVRVVLALLSDALVACNAPRDLLVIQVVWLAFLVPGVVLGIRWGGPAGVALGLLAVSVAVALPMTLLLLRRHVSIDVSRMASSILLTAVSAALAAAVARMTASTTGGVWPALLLGTAAGALTYVLVSVRRARRLSTSLRLMLDSDPADLETLNPTSASTEWSSAPISGRDRTHA
jgi:lipopolysaccharide exporter